MVVGRPQIRLVCGIILALLGVLWIVQGLDLLGMDGGMNGETVWVVAGAVTAVAGAAIAISGARARNRL
jgi:hypothetical protein